jgi:uncharacterized membrane protein (Fun14 family)
MTQESVPVESSKWGFFNKPTRWYLQMATFFVGGFVAGLILKYLGRYLVWLIIAVLVLWSLEHFELITINHAAVKSFLGLSSEASWNELLVKLGDWVQVHMPESIAAAIGLLMAWIFM